MFLIGVLFGIFCLVTFLMPWAQASRIKGLNEEVSEMRRDIRTLQTIVSRIQIKEPAEEIASAVPSPEFRQQPVTRQMIEEYEASYISRNIEETSPEEAVVKKEEFIQRPSGNSFELNLGTKLPVWIGAISLICAAFFLVKYSIEAGLLGPLARISIGTLFGTSLVAAGQWIVARASIANSKRIAQGLVGAGLVTLYFSSYAAVSLYHLIPPLFGFGAMTVVTILSVIMSLRHGQPIAIFGMIGGLLTPALVGSHEPNAMALFGYLFVLFTGMLNIMARKGWWTLASAALAGVFLWTAFWFSTVFTSVDSLVLVLFPVAICISVLSATKSHVMNQDSFAPVHNLNLLALAGGAVTILWLSFRITLSPFDWSMLGLITIGCMGLSYFRPAIYMNALLSKLAIDLLLFAIWVHKAAMPETTAITAGLAALYVVIPYFIMRRVQDPRLWAGLQLVSSVALYIICYYRIPFSSDFNGKSLWGIISIALAGLSVWQAAIMRHKYNADDVVQDHLVSIYALAATCFISLGLAIELPHSYLPIAFAAQSAATMWIYDRSDINILRTITMILSGLFVALNYEQISLFGHIIAGSIDKTAISTSFASQTMLAMPMLHLGLPALFFALALMCNRSQNSLYDTLSHVLFGTMLALILATLYYLVRDSFHIEQWYLAVQAGFIERGIISLMMVAVAASILLYAKYTGSDLFEVWGAALFHVTMARIVFFDLILHNPYQDGTQIVGHWPILNGITMVYGMGAALSLYALRNQAVTLGQEIIENVYKVLGIIFLLVLSSLSVRQYFHPDVLHSSNPMSHTEFYTYSVVWLLMGLSLLTFGIAFNSKAGRVASLAFLLLTIGKVFLLDASELEGLYRVFSFLGLGLSLIGLSYFYTKFIKRGDIDAENTGNHWL